MLIHFHHIRRLLFKTSTVGPKIHKHIFDHCGKLQHPRMSAVTAVLTLSILRLSLLLILENVVEKFILYDINTVILKANHFL